MSELYFPGIRDDISKDDHDLMVRSLHASGLWPDKSLEEVLYEQPAEVPRLRCSMLQEFVVTGSMGWKHKPVTYCPRLSLNGISDSQSIQTFHDACAAWNAVAAVNLLYTPDFDRANIFARSGKIDGVSGTLAWSYLPQNVKPTSRLEQLYDNGEKWTIPWLLDTIIHEIGHALGLTHSSDKKDIMYAWSTGGAMSRPQPGDIRRLLSLGYDAPIVGPPVLPPPVSPPGTGPSVTGIIMVGNDTYGLVKMS